MSPAIELCGAAAATLTSAAFAPQAWRTVRTRDTSGLSLAYLGLFLGNALWLAYGAFIGSWPLIGANIITVPLIAVILALKLRHG